MILDNSLIDNFRDLLYNFWIVKDENEELYYKIKYNQNKIKDFVSKNLGSNLIVHNRFIKLEKIPSYTKGGEGIEGFNNVIDYVMLSLILLFLEDKARGDLFILTDLIDYIKNTSITLELNHIPDWNLRSDRKGLDAAINFLIGLSAIKLKDKDKVSFVDSKDSQALYEVTGISNYVMRLFDTPITNIDNVPDLLRLEFLNQDEEKGDVRRYKVFRDILYLPSTSTKDISSSEIDYIKKNRNYIKGELSSKLDMEVEITNNLVMLYDDTSSTLKDNFPNTKKITEIVLMVNKEILDDIKKGKILLDNNECATVDINYLKMVIKKIKLEKIPYIGKTIEKYQFDKFYTEVVNYMIMYNFISINEESVTIYPSVSRMVGITKEINKNEQMDMFGDDVDV